MPHYVITVLLYSLNKRAHISKYCSDDSDDDGYNGYGEYNEYGKCDRGYYYRDRRYERKTSPMMSFIISPVIA